MQASILLLEPEMKRSRQVRRALECHGHRILAVPNAATALGALRHVRFDIFLAPLAPLTISAQALSAQAKLLQPQLRVLVVDELDSGPIVLHAAVDGYIRKPVCESALGEAIRAVLAKSAGPATRPGTGNNRPD